MDIAGIVSDNGTSTKYRVGDRVIAPGIPGWSDASSFQTHALVQEPYSSKIPDNMTFEQVATLPFCLITAACGLFVNMGLTIDGEPENKGWILIWGANGSVGSLAIQLARIANYRVIAVTSTTTGASQARDHGADFAFARDDPHLISKIAELPTRPKWALDTGASRDTIEQISQCIEPSGIIVTAQKYTGELIPGATLASIFAAEMFGKTMTGESNGIKRLGRPVSGNFQANFIDGTDYGLTGTQTERANLLGNVVPTQARCFVCAVAASPRMHTTGKKPPLCTGIMVSIGVLLLAVSNVRPPYAILIGRFIASLKVYFQGLWMFYIRLYLRISLPMKRDDMPPQGIYGISGHLALLLFLPIWMRPGLLDLCV
ncbi:hypothetical protein ACJZ2D_015690 [Fusarium nematophilum]